MKSANSLSRSTVLSDKGAKAALAAAFANGMTALDTRTLAESWNELSLTELPKRFDWETLANVYLETVRDIRRQSPLLGQVLDSQNLQRLADIAQQAAPLSPSFDLARYAEAMREKYGRLQIESLDLTGSYYRELELWRVFIPQQVRECQEYLPQVLELPKDHLRRLRDGGELEGRDFFPGEIEKLRRHYLDQPSRNVLELVEDPRLLHLVILGDPGSGKSSLLRALLLRWTEAPSADLPGLDLPLLIELRAYAQARQKDEDIQDFLEFFHRGPSVAWHLDQHRLKEQLEAGRVRVFFDGLDEVFDPALREEVIAAIHRFSNEYPRARLIVTSRPIGYKGEIFRNANFRHYMLQELDDDQIGAFLNNWHRDTYRPAEAHERQEKHAARQSHHRLPRHPRARGQSAPAHHDGHPQPQPGFTARPRRTL